MLKKNYRHRYSRTDLIGRVQHRVALLGGSAPVGGNHHMPEGRKALAAKAKEFRRKGYLKRSKTSER